VPQGYQDYLTWQSRRIRLLPNDGQHLSFTSMQMLQGMRLTNSFGSSEPMMAYVKNHKDEYRAKRFDESRSLWRDSHVLLSGVDHQKTPLSIQQAEQLKRRGFLNRTYAFRVAALGLSAEKGRVDFWRHETMPLPLAYLGDKALLDDLRDALEAVEGAGKAVSESIRKLAESVSTGSQGRPDQDRVKQLAKAFYQQSRFWARLENPFRHLLQELPGRDDEARLKTLEQWGSEVCRIARDTFNDIVDSLDASPRILKGVYSDQGGAQKTLNVALHKILQIGKEPAHA
jgi:CRISPR system Cascade subunit CasA